MKTRKFCPRCGRPVHQSEYVILQPDNTPEHCADIQTLFESIEIRTETEDIINNFKDLHRVVGVYNRTNPDYKFTIKPIGFHKKTKAKRSRKFCPHCGRPVVKSEIKGYAFQCLSCDEDFYLIEVLSKKELEISNSTTLMHIKKLYETSEVCMGEMLASVPADHLSLEEAFELYIAAMKWAEGDRFYKSENDELPIEIEPQL